MQPKSMIIIGLLLIVASFLLLSNRRGIIDSVYTKAADELRATMDQPDYDQEALQQEARALELRVVRTDETLLYGGIILGLLGLALFHVGLLRPRPALDTLLAQPDDEQFMTMNIAANNPAIDPVEESETKDTDVVKEDL